MTSDRIISNENDMSKETVAGDESGIIQKLHDMRGLNVTMVKAIPPRPSEVRKSGLKSWRQSKDK